MILRRGIRMSCQALLLIPMLTQISFGADDGATIFRERCATCHGKQGTGKRSAKGPSLVSERVKSMSDASIGDLVASRANGEMERKSAHTSMKKRLTSGEITAVVAHIRELQKAK
jgi:cytochrome c553